MDKDRLNNMVVDLFHGISYEEEKAVITDEFKDISNKDLHLLMRSESRNRRICQRLQEI